MLHYVVGVKRCFSHDRAGINVKRFDAEDKVRKENGIDNLEVKSENTMRLGLLNPRY